MFIRNLVFDPEIHYRCSKRMANYLNDQGFVSIGYSKRKKVFLRTERLQETLLDLPIKFRKGGDIFEQN